MQPVDKQSPQNLLCKPSIYARRCPHVLHPTAHERLSLGIQPNAHPRCPLDLQPSTCGLKKQDPFVQPRIAVEKAARLEERVRDLRRLLEADYRHLQASSHTRKIPPPHELAAIDGASHLDITLSYNSSSELDTYSSFDSVLRDDLEYTYQASCGVSTQATDLRGIGQWIEGAGSVSRKLYQDPGGTIGCLDLDLARVHVLAAPCPFERYLRMRRHKEERLNYQMYLLLP